MRHLLPLRRAVLTALKDDERLIEIIPAAQIHPQAPLDEPIWPFIRMGALSGLPREASCLNGATGSFDVHCFTKAIVDGGGAVIESAEDHCLRALSAMVSALHRRALVLDDGFMSATVRCGQTNVLVDGVVAGAFHGVVSCTAKVTAA